MLLAEGTAGYPLSSRNVPRAWGPCNSPASPPGRNPASVRMLELAAIPGKVQRIVGKRELTGGQKVSQLRPLDGVSVAVNIHVQPLAGGSEDRLSGGSDKSMVFAPCLNGIGVSLRGLHHLPVRVELLRGEAG